jgi:hypothetical protein
MRQRLVFAQVMRVDHDRADDVLSHVAVIALHFGQRLLHGATLANATTENHDFDSAPQGRDNRFVIGFSLRLTFAVGFRVFGLWVTVIAVRTIWHDLLRHRAVRDGTVDFCLVVVDDHEHMDTGRDWRGGRLAADCSRKWRIASRSSTAVKSLCLGTCKMTVWPSRVTFSVPLCPSATTAKASSSDRMSCHSKL